MSRVGYVIGCACALLLGAAGCNWIIGVDKDFEEGLVLSGGSGGTADAGGDGGGGSDAGGSGGGGNGGSG